MPDDLLAGALAELQGAVGAVLPDPHPPHWAMASADAIAHFVRSYGDDNPVYCDTTTARRSARGGLIAPPLFPLSTGIPTHEALTSVIAFPGVADPGIDAEHWVLHRPIGEGARLSREKRLLSVRPRSDVAGSASYVVVERTRFADGGVTVATRDRERRFWLGRLAPLPAPGDRSAVYDADELEVIATGYAAERRRGTEPRHASTVGVGDEVGPMTKGPLTVTDLVDYRAGVGPGPLGGGPLRLAWRNRVAHPGLYDIDAHGAYDIVERRHWDDGYARAMGLPGAYDYSHTRLVWLSHLLCDWMGDGGHLYRLSGTTALGPNYVGDTHWLRGTVTRVHDGQPGRVDLTLTATNQLGHVTCRADAVVLLPRPGSEIVDPEALVAFDSGSSGAIGTPEATLPVA